MKKQIALCLMVMAFGCKKMEQTTVSETTQDPLYTKMSSQETGISFVNRIESSTDLNVFKYRNFYNGGGVGIGDLNNDGLPDVYLTSNMGENKLYLNKGDFKFEDITQTAGVAGINEWSTGVVLVDINADGFLDIYVCNAGNVKGDNQKNELYINNGDLTFTEKAEEYGLADSGFTSHAAFFDYDGDGDLDVYILNNSFISVESLGYNNKRDVRAEDWPVSPTLRGGGDKLLRNDNGKFTDVSQKAGIYGSLIGFGLGVNIGDVNHDGWYDIYVSNDFYEQDYLYLNQKDGTFKDASRNFLSHMSFFSMGADVADINNDGFQDIFTTDMLPEKDSRVKEVSTFESYDLRKFQEQQDLYYQFMHNNLHLNNQNGTFSEIGYFSGVAKTDWSWGALMFDIDNDGYRDIFVSNGILHDLTNQDFMNFFANDIVQNMIIYGKKEAVDSIISKMPSVPIPNYAFKNKGNLTFENYAQEWGLDEPSFSNGAAYGDLDNDGDLDLIVNNVNKELFVYRNETTQKLQNNYLKIKLEGQAPNTFGFGARVKIFNNGSIHYTEQLPARGFQSSVEQIITVGLGKSEKVDSVQVIWANAQFETRKNIELNRQLTFKEEDAKEKYLFDDKTKAKKLMTSVETKLPSHQENQYVDYDYEGLITKMISLEGPAFASADINGDGLHDIFIGGATSQSGNIFIQNVKNQFVKINSAAFAKDSYFEDTAAVFADVNGDGAPDLIVGSGGNEASKGKQWYATRLYLNDGTGQFKQDAISLPYSQHNVSAIAPFDFDGDGDVDLFIAARSIPGLYGPNPKSLLLENDGSGLFKDVTERKAYDVQNIGMVTDASWEDIDSDGIKDLVLVGDWMSPKIYKNNRRRLSEMTTNLDQLSGWWQAVKTADLNADGKPDLVLGNYGTNGPYFGSAKNPLKLYVHDFDNNGTIEQVMTHISEGKEKPVNLRNDLANQIPDVKKQNIIYSAYAQKSIGEVFPKNILDKAIQKTQNFSQSVVAMNLGNGQFEMIALPDAVQFANVSAIAIADLNKDGILDLITGGNLYENRPQFGRLDTNYGSVLIGNGDGTFRLIPYRESGLSIVGMVKHLQQVNDEAILAIRNNDTPLLFKIN
ncbi:MAG: VCBS repeat-containing protein [Bacteroidetes bacterium]|nr:VCBS repeat-containing protein [Bacteroidota bacterium]